MSTPEITTHLFATVAEVGTLGSANVVRLELAGRVSITLHVSRECAAAWGKHLYKPVTLTVTVRVDEEVTP